MKQILFALFVLAAPAAQAGTLAEEMADPADRPANLAILAATPDANGVFTVQDDGTVRHVQSGLVCPSGFPNMKLAHLLVYPSAAGPGTDVGCDYGRANKGRADSKLTIFAVKAAEGATLVDVFARYRSEVVQTVAGLQPNGAVFVIDDHKSAKPLPKFQSEEFVGGNGAFTTSLIVALQGGWVAEIRETYPGLPNHVDVTEAGGKDEAVNMAGDRIMPVHAFLAVAGTIGKTQEGP